MIKIKRNLATNNLVNKRYNKLVVLKQSNYRKYNQLSLDCICDCGNTVIATTNELNFKRVQSCGCLLKELNKNNNTTRKYKNKRLYTIYFNMKNRCLNPNNTHYKYYGGKGITICDEWLGKNGSTNFCDWAFKNGYMDDLTIERIDNSKGYSPNNCRWAKTIEQYYNKTNNNKITICGVTRTLSQWCNIFNVKYSTVSDRYYSGWNIEKALTTPLLKQKGIRKK